jgi:hypothetical protein
MAYDEVRKKWRIRIVVGNEIFLKQQKLYEVFRETAREAAKMDTPFIPKEGSQCLDLKTQVFTDDPCERLYPDCERSDLSQYSSGA